MQTYIHIFTGINYIYMHAGVEHVGGDMFESVPKGDAIFMKVRIVGEQVGYILLFRVCLVHDVRHKKGT